MAEERILLTVDFDSDSARKKVVELQIQIDATKQKNKELSDSFKAGLISEQAYIKGTVEGTKAISAMTNEQAGLNRNINLATIANNKSKDSLNALSAQYRTLVERIRDMSKEERENTEAGKALVAQAASINEELKAQEKAYGSTGRNVGNYRDEIKAAFKEMGVFGGITEKVTALQEGFSKAQVIAKAAIGGNISVLKLLKLALASTGIGLIVIALGSLVTFLTKTQKGADFLSRTMAGFGAIFSRITKDVAAFGEKIFDAFSNPKQALIDLVDLIQNNLTNRIKGFAVILDGILNADLKKFNDGLLQVGTGVENLTDKTTAFLSDYAKTLKEAAEAGFAIEKENQRILKAERELNVERAKAKSLIEQLKFIAEDTTKPIEERIKATKEAFALEQKSADAQLKIQKDKIKNLKAEQALGEILNEDRDKLAEEEIKLAELKEASTTRSIELNNKLNSLYADQKRQEEEMQKLIREGRQAEIDFDFEQLNKKRIAAFSKADTQLLQNALDSTKALRDVEEERTRLKLEELEQQYADLKKFGKDTTDVENQIASQRVAIAQSSIAKEIKLNQDKLMALSEIGNALGAVQNLINTQNAEGAAFAKALALAQIAISTAVAIAKAVAGAQDLPFPANLIAALTSVTAVLSGIAQAKAALESGPETPEPPQFYEGGLYDADGGYTERGNPREEARNLGDKPYTYHKDEYIIPHTVLATSEGSALARAAERLRRMHPSNPSISGMYNGGPADGGLTARSITNGFNANDVANIVISAIKAQKAPVVSVTQFNEVNASSQGTVAKATL